MTIVPLSGMNKDDFMNALNLDVYDETVDELIELGWITESDEIICLHQVISDLLYRNNLTKPDFEKLHLFIDSPELLNNININDRSSNFDSCYGRMRQ